MSNQSKGLVYLIRLISLIHPVHPIHPAPRPTHPIFVICSQSIQSNRIMNSVFGILIFLFQLIFGFNPLEFSDNAEYPLPNKLKEISGLEILNDSTLVALNDGGNDAELYLLNFKGEILKEVPLEDTKNRDWEDIARDDNFIYIGDIGNNNNTRENLVVLKVKIEDLLTKDKVKPKKIKFSYKEQTAFPPEDASLFFDAEGMTVLDDSIWIFTKDRSKPFQGKSWVYKLPLTPGDYEISSSNNVITGTDGWWTDGVTAVDHFNDQFYVLTYNRYIVYDYAGGEFKKSKEHVFDRITQRESIVVLNDATIFVADEQNPLAGKGRLCKIRVE